MVPQNILSWGYTAIAAPAVEVNLKRKGNENFIIIGFSGLLSAALYGILLEAYFGFIDVYNHL